MTQPGDILPGRRYTPDTVDLFLYNAAIWNAHRIHYDQDYTSEVEKHPGLLIDGPLIGDWLSQVVLDWLGEHDRLLAFGYSNRRAAYLGETLETQGQVSAVQGDQVEIELRVVNENGDLITPGHATVKLGSP